MVLNDTGMQIMQGDVITTDVSRDKIIEIKRSGLVIFKRDEYMPDTKFRNLLERIDMIRFFVRDEKITKKQRETLVKELDSVKLLISDVCDGDK